MKRRVKVRRDEGHSWQPAGAAWLLLLPSEIGEEYSE
jgi:hypothetical protein